MAPAVSWKSRSCCRKRMAWQGGYGPGGWSGQGPGPCPLRALIWLAGKLRGQGSAQQQRWLETLYFTLWALATHRSCLPEILYNGLSICHKHSQRPRGPRPGWLLPKGAGLAPELEPAPPRVPWGAPTLLVSSCTVPSLGILYSLSGSFCGEKQLVPSHSFQGSLRLKPCSSPLAQRHLLAMGVKMPCTLRLSKMAGQKRLRAHKETA